MVASRLGGEIGRPLCACDVALMYAGNRMNNRESKKEESKKKEQQKEEEQKPKKPWLVPYRFGPNNCANPSGRPKKKPITDRYREALEGRRSRPRDA